jgi:hypothetical protein
MTDSRTNDMFDCRQDGVCATPPGCQRHWEERNRELLQEMQQLRAAVAASVTAEVTGWIHDNVQGDLGPAQWDLLDAAIARGVRVATSIARAVVAAQQTLAGCPGGGQENTDPAPSAQLGTVPGRSTDSSHGYQSAPTEEDTTDRTPASADLSVVGGAIPGVPSRVAGDLELVDALETVALERLRRAKGCPECGSLDKFCGALGHLEAPVAATVEPAHRHWSDCSECVRLGGYCGEHKVCANLGCF